MSEHQPNPTQQDRIYTVLKALQANDHSIPADYLFLDDAGLWVSCRYFKQVMFISESNGRISELRAKGFNIETNDEKDNFGFAYHRLSDEPIKEQPEKRSGKSGPKVLMMGKEVSYEDLPEAEALAIEDYFAPVKLSPAAVDRASQIVPDQYWRKDGIYSWLEGRANEAFKKMPGSDKEIVMGRLRYSFEYVAEGPQLKMVALMSASVTASPQRAPSPVS